MNSLRNLEVGYRLLVREQLEKGDFLSIAMC
jgi:hypothetical protein